MPRPYRWLSLFPLILGACGAPSTSANQPSHDLQDYVEAFCKRQLACPFGELDYGDQASCERFSITVFCGETDLALPDLGRCTRALEEEANCQEERTAPLPAECDGVARALAKIRGVALAEDGEACDLTHGCKAGSFCTGEYSTDPGVCQPVGKEGDACTEIRSCGLDLHCDSEGFSREKTCLRRGPAGTACLSGRECDEGLDCVQDMCVDPYALIGTVCVDTTVCGSKLLCYGGLCSPRRVLGEDCMPGECVFGTACMEGTCTATESCGRGESGAPCQLDSQCAAGLVCDLASGRCAKD